jgi:hypothetical protein
MRNCETRTWMDQERQRKSWSPKETYFLCPSSKRKDAILGGELQIKPAVRRCTGIVGYTRTTLETNRSGVDASHRTPEPAIASSGALYRGQGKDPRAHRMRQEAQELGCGVFVM